jgi:uncharacterized protein (UPF0335 family)
VTETTLETGDVIGAAGRAKLSSFVARIERLDEERAAIAADIKEVYGEAKSFGYDTKIIRKVVALRKMDQNERAEQEALLDLYLGALGDTPLGEAAKRAARESCFRESIRSGEVSISVGGLSPAEAEHIDKLADQDAEAAA